MRAREKFNVSYDNNYYGPQQPQPPQQPVVIYAGDPGNNTALAPVSSLVAGILAISISWIPILGVGAWIFAPLAVIFGILGLRRGKTEHKIMSGIGLGLGALALVICIIWAVAFVVAMASTSIT
jgi:hypothetical protein